MHMRDELPIENISQLADIEELEQKTAPGQETVLPL